MTLLTKLQSAIVFELQEHSSLTGYELTKILEEKGLNFSHQQVYRDLNKMPLKMVLVPQDGKPDQKRYSLSERAQYQHDIKKINLDFLLVYPEPKLIERKLSELDECLKKLANVPLSILNCFRIERANLDREYLLNLNH